MRVLVTGMIAGMDDRPYLDRVVELGQQEGLAVRSYNLVDALEATGGKRLDMLLGTTNYLFEVLREREYRKIGFDLQKNQVEHALVRVPATIEWNRINWKLKDHEEIGQFIQPDVIVTLIDAEWLIRQRFREPQVQSPFLQRIKQQEHSIHEVLSWMNEEVSLSEDWARMLGVRHYVLPLGQDPRELFKLVKYREVPTFYASYSMTHSDETARQHVNEVIARLSNYGIVMDPQAIEIGFEFESEQDREATYAFTVHRDLHWFVGKVDAVVAVHPYEQRPPLSTGMMDELGHARDYMKKRYMVFPPKHLSPFTTDSYIEKGHVFPDPDSLFACLEDEGFKPLE